MRSILAVFFFVFASTFSYAQDTLALTKEKKTFSKYSISLAVGIGLRYSDVHYSSMRFDDQTGNPIYPSNLYLEQGISASVNFDCHFKETKCILTFSAGYNHVPYDIANYGNDLYLELIDSLANTHATSYEIFTFLPGIKYPFNLGKFTFYFQVMAGLLIYHSPYISYTEYSYPPSQRSSSLIKTAPFSGTPQDVTITSKTGIYIPLNLGTGIEYHIGNNIFMIFSADFFSPFNNVIAVPNLRMGAGVDF